MMLLIFRDNDYSDFVVVVDGDGVVFVLKGGGSIKSNVVYL